MYTQCTIVHDDGRTQVAWIESKFAKQHHYLKISGENGWMITYVYNSRNDMDRRSNDYRRMSTFKGQVSYER